METFVLDLNAQVWERISSYLAFLIIKLMLFSPGNIRLDLFGSWHSNDSLNLHRLLHKFWKSNLFIFVSIPFPTTGFKV